MTIPSRKRRALIVAACLAVAGAAIGVASITRVKRANRARQGRATIIEQASRTMSRALEGSCEVLEMRVPRHPPAAGDFYTGQEKKRVFQKEEQQRFFEKEEQQRFFEQ